MTPAKRRTKWTGAEKLRVVIAAQNLSETELGAFLRCEGLHEVTARTKALPLATPRKRNFTTNEASWISLDVSPDELAVDPPAKR